MKGYTIFLLKYLQKLHVFLILKRGEHKTFLCTRGGDEENFAPPILHSPHSVNNDRSLNPKRAGLFGPISQPGGGADSAPPKISETD